MNDVEIRLACLRLAVDQPGNPNTVSEAQKFYDFALAGKTEKTDEATKAPSEESNINMPQQARRKGNGK